MTGLSGRKYFLPTLSLMAAILAMVNLAGCGSDTAGACADVTCSGNGECSVLDGNPLCTCAQGFHAAGLECVADSTSSDPCSNVGCSGHGQCSVSNGAALCTCNQGFHAVGLECVADSTTTTPCTNVTCSGHGQCSVINGAPICTCGQGYHAVGLECVADSTTTTPCTNVTCSGHGQCSVTNGTPVCTCAQGYHPVGLQCISNSVDSCVDMNCPEHSYCDAPYGYAQCYCDDGYHPAGSECVPDSGSCVDPSGSGFSLSTSLSVYSDWHGTHYRVSVSWNSSSVQFNDWACETEGQCGYRVEYWLNGWHREVFGPSSGGFVWEGESQSFQFRLIAFNGCGEVVLYSNLEVHTG
jgi:hypothetical protein